MLVACSTASNCIVVFLRMFTSAVIRTSVEDYAPFLFHPETGEDIAPQDFCERFVEATGKEAGALRVQKHIFSVKLRSIKLIGAVCTSRPHPDHRPHQSPQDQYPSGIPGWPLCFDSKLRRLPEQRGGHRE